jgi:nicotinamide mononucleotide transporter
MEQVKATTWLEWVAVLLGIAEVLLAKANKVWLYPTGIAATLISIYLLLNVALYAECLLSCYYVVMSFYGWYHWIKKRNEPPVKVSYANRQEWTITLLIVFVGWGVYTCCLSILHNQPCRFGMHGYHQPHGPVCGYWQGVK